MAKKLKDNTRVRFASISEAVAYAIVIAKKKRKEKKRIIMTKTTQISFDEITHLIIVCEECGGETKIPIDSTRTLLSHCGICRTDIPHRFFDQFKVLKDFKIPRPDEINSANVKFKLLLEIHKEEE